MPGKMACAATLAYWFEAQADLEPQAPERDVSGIPGTPTVPKRMGSKGLGQRLVPILGIITLSAL